MSLIRGEIRIKKLCQENVDEYLKTIFSKKEDVIYRQDRTEKNICEFEYKDIIKEKIVEITVKLIMGLDNQELEEIEIECMDEGINENDLWNYYYSNLYKDISLNILRQEQRPYTIRVYYYILHDTGFRGEYICSLKNRIAFKPLFNESIKNTYTERIIAFDCEVEGVSLTHARTKAINIVKDFVAQLSLLIDTGFYFYDSYFAHFINRDMWTNELVRCFYRKSFFDPELQVYVTDNILGVRHLKDYEQRDKPSFSSFRLISVDELAQSTKNETIQMEVNYDECNFELDKVLQRHKIKKNKQQKIVYAEEIDVDGMYKPYIYVPKQIRSYFRGIERLSGRKNTYFRNCCRLYNISQTCGAHEPTLMISYMVSAVECLAKAESLGFSEFMRSYLGEKYDKAFCDELYGSIRSGHFHAGEMFFDEYSVNIDPRLDGEYSRSQRKMISARHVLRLAIINWVKEYILLDREK